MSMRRQPDRLASCSRSQVAVRFSGRDECECHSDSSDDSECGGRPRSSRKLRSPCVPLRRVTVLTVYALIRPTLVTAVHHHGYRRDKHGRPEWVYQVLPKSKLHSPPCWLPDRDAACHSVPGLVPGTYDSYVAYTSGATSTVTSSSLAILAAACATTIVAAIGVFA